MIDLASKTGMRLVQLLPVNDTSVNMMWWDSYPYRYEHFLINHIGAVLPGCRFFSLSPGFYENENDVLPNYVDTINQKKLFKKIGNVSGESDYYLRCLGETKFLKLI
jgi:hypothetical protein